MKLQTMIDALQGLLDSGVSPDAEVRAIDSESGQYAPVTEFDYDKGRVDIGTDNDDEGRTDMKTPKQD
jgi:hypothetical protein